MHLSTQNIVFTCFGIDNHIYSLVLYNKNKSHLAYKAKPKIKKICLR